MRLSTVLLRLCLCCAHCSISDKRILSADVVVYAGGYEVRARTRSTQRKRVGVRPLETANLLSPCVRIFLNGVFVSHVGVLMSNVDLG
ncbi:unnamed protein product [Ceratitis capitata]|uniref:(Mediterranean fruit fly) hypothetical protein n=1 Tax=Ceratitis capitata TaxID=7213 RepID=A0A811V6S9_CERCA|nr:unnamed protein product [Ceratitis capitata]